MIQDVSISKATVPDCAVLLLLQKECYLQEAKINNDYNIPPLVQTIDEYINEFAQYTILKTEYKNSIIGSVRSKNEGSICKIGRLFVKPEYQGLGIGRKLLNTIEEENNSVEKYELFTGKESTRNIAFYTQLGYTIVGEQRLTEKTYIIIMEKKNRIAG